MRWTYHELSEVFRLFKAGKTPEQIATLIGRSIWAVRQKTAHQQMTSERAPLVKRKPFGKVSAADRYRAAIKRQLQELRR